MSKHGCASPPLAKMLEELVHVVFGPCRLSYLVPLLDEVEGERDSWDYVVSVECSALVEFLAFGDD